MTTGKCKKPGCEEPRLERFGMKFRPIPPPPPMQTPRGGGGLCIDIFAKEPTIYVYRQLQIAEGTPFGGDKKKVYIQKTREKYFAFDLSSALSHEALHYILMQVESFEASMALDKPRTCARLNDFAWDRLYWET